MVETQPEIVGDELDLQAVKKRSVAGVIAITSRTFFLQIVALIANFLFGIFLLPEEYGVFYGVSALIEFFVIFSDVGLAAALIQKKENLDDNDLKTTFTVQQILVNSLAVIAFLAAPIIGQFYNLSPQGVWLFRALAVSLVLASLKTIPSIRLERRLEFSKLVIPQVVENALFYVTAVFLAWKGFGVESFSWAVLVRGLAGLIVIYSLAPWRPAFGLNPQIIRQLFSFGIPFQLNSIIAFVKDKLIIAFLFKVLTPAEVGYLGWAQKWSHYPLQLVMDSVNKVTFPTYSRLQHHTAFLKKAIEKAVFFTSLLVFPLVIGLIAIAPAFVRLFVEYAKWQPALPALSLFAVAALWASLSTTLTNTLSALGDIKLNLKLMVMWTTLIWLLTPLLIRLLGFNGAALASALVAFTSVIPIILVKKKIPFYFWAAAGPNFVAAVIMGTVTYILAQNAGSLLELIGSIILGGGIYIGCNFLMQGRKIIQEVRSLKAIFVSH